MNIGIIDYGAGNLRSLSFALERIGAKSFASADPEALRKADRLLFPGVGAAGFAMERLQSCGLDELILSWQRPLLGICLGMQLLCRYSEEQDTTCIGVFPVDVTRFQGPEKVPHTGWNSLERLSGPLFDETDRGAFVYYVHSYRAGIAETTIAVTDYIGSFSGALQRDNYFGVQFHPEKSGRVGDRILKNFLAV